MVWQWQYNNHNSNKMWHCNCNSTLLLQPFYGSLDFVQDYPGKPEQKVHPTTQFFTDWMSFLPPKQQCQSRKQECTHREQTSADLEDPDFGLWTTGFEAWSRSPPKLYHFVLEPCPTPPKISSKSIHEFASNPTDRQTNRLHGKHNLLLRRR